MPDEITEIVAPIPEPLLFDTSTPSVALTIETSANGQQRAIGTYNGARIDQLLPSGQRPALLLYNSEANVLYTVPVAPLLNDTQDLIAFYLAE